MKVEAAAADEAVDIYVQGRPGTHQWLQLFGTAGPRQVQVYAHTASGKTEFVELPIEVVDCEATWPRLQLALDAEHDRMVDFVVANAQELGEGLSYHWTFGDGAEVDTDVPAVRHTYAIDAIDWHSPDTAFQASVEAVGVCPSTLARKSVVYHHEYARMLKGGIVQPPLEYDVAGHTGDYTIHNVEAEALVLDHATSTWQPCLPGGELREGPSGAASVEVDGHGVYAGHIDLSGAPEDACGMELRLTGVLKGHSELRVDVPLYFEVKESTSRIQRVRDPGVIHMLEQADAAGLLPPDGTSVGDLQQYAREGRFEFVYPTPPIDEGADPAPGSVVPLAGGFRCNAHDTGRPDYVDARWQCLPTGEYEVLTSYVANAHAGDIALSAGCGLIGSLLRAVTPAQHYSHTGIFTRDFDAIRNSTASEDWLEDDSDGVEHLSGGDGILGRYLRHMWPGLISESADEAWYGHLLRSDHPNDASPRVYELHTFNTNPVTCEGDGDSQTWPQLIRPLPIGLGNTPAQADINRRDARATAGRVAWMGGHYRLFGYTIASISLDDPYHRWDWPEGLPGRDGRNRGVVCSSSIWTATRDDNHDDHLGGIPVGGLGADSCDLEGLYGYDADERAAGAQLVHDRVYQGVLDKHPDTGALLDTADDIADQITNCFVSDDCDQHDGTDHNEWRHPGTGCAVSPDDVMRWTETWGYQEPIAFRHAQLRPVYAWQPPNDGLGEVRITVVDLATGAPIEGAEVSLGVDSMDTASVGRSDADGHVLSENAPAGSEVARAWVWRPNPDDPSAPGFVATGFKLFELGNGEHKEVTVELDRSDQAGVLQRQQLVKVTYDATVTDDEWFGSERNSEHHDGFVTLDAYQPTRAIDFSTCAGHEAIVRVHVTLTLKEEGNVDAQVTMKFFEGTDCGTHDREDRWESELTTVADGTEVSFSQALINDGVFGGDDAWVDLAIENSHRYAP